MRMDLDPNKGEPDNGSILTDMSVARRCLLFSLAALVAMTSACRVPPAKGCTLEARPGLRVEVRDSITRAPAGENASVVATEGTYEETLQTFDAIIFAGLYERRGNYSVSVQKTGYEPWQQELRVTGNECHVKTVDLQVNLESIS